MSHCKSLSRRGRGSLYLRLSVHLHLSVQDEIRRAEMDMRLRRIHEDFEIGVVVAIEVDGRQEPRMLGGVIAHEGSDDLTGRSGEIADEVKLGTACGLTGEAAQIDVILPDRE